MFLGFKNEIKFIRCIICYCLRFIYLSLVWRIVIDFV